MTISSSLFFLLYKALHMYPFFHSLPIYRFHTVSISLTLSFSVCVSIYSKSSSAFNSLCLSRFSYFLFLHLCCLFVFFSFFHKACNYVSVPGMVSIIIMNERIHCESTNYGGKLLSNCPKCALKTKYQVFSVTAKRPR